MFHPDISQIVRRLVELGVRGVIRGDTIHINGEERSAVIWPLGPERHWYAGDERIEIWGRLGWQDEAAEDAQAWVERGERVYRYVARRRR